LKARWLESRSGKRNLRDGPRFVLQALASGAWGILMVKSGEGSRGTPKNKGKKMRTDMEGGSSERGRAQIDLRIQHEIGKHLRAVYDGVINEPVPSKFMELLEKLERSTTRKS
jgi:hypothetical protein